MSAGAGGGGSGGGGGGGGPCGACKFLRRKCVRECIFAPHFDSHKGAAHFAAVHKVFGASNVSKLLLRIPAHDRPDAVVTICYEAQARLSDPVLGCVAHVFALHQQVMNIQAELSYIQARLATLQLPPPHSSLPSIVAAPSTPIDPLASQRQPPWSLQQQQYVEDVGGDHQQQQQMQQQMQLVLRHMEDVCDDGGGGGGLQALAGGPCIVNTPMPGGSLRPTSDPLRMRRLHACTGFTIDSLN